MRYLCVLYAYSCLAMPAEDTICKEVEAIIADKEYTTGLAVALLDNYASCGRLLQAESSLRDSYKHELPPVCCFGIP